MENAPRPGETVKAFVRRRVLFRATWLTVGLVAAIILRWATGRDLQWTLFIAIYLVVLLFVAGGGGLYDYLRTQQRIPPMDRTPRPGETAKAYLRRRIVFYVAGMIVAFVALVIFRWALGLKMQWTPMIAIFLGLLLMAGGAGIYDYLRMRQRNP